MLDVRRLRVLREVAAHGSFSAAAESLAFTQPAVSRQIATLEAEAGTRLVDRSARGVRLTQAGELLVGHADAILDRLTAAESQLDALSSLEGGRLRIGAPATANSTLIPLAMRAFDEEFPEVHLRLDEAISCELIARARRRRPRHRDRRQRRPLPELPGEIVLEPLMDDPLHLAVARDHPLAEADGSAWPTSPTSLDRGPRPGVRRAAAARRAAPPASSRRSASSRPSGWASRGSSPRASASR